MTPIKPVSMSAPSGLGAGFASRVKPQTGGFSDMIPKPKAKPAAARPGLPAFGRGMNGAPALSETRFGTGMNGERNPIAESYSQPAAPKPPPTEFMGPTAPETPLLPPPAIAGPTPDEREGEFTKYLSEQMANVPVKESGIGIGGRLRGRRGARRGDTIKGGRFYGKTTGEATGMLRNEFDAMNP